ncbi:hypothetical protein MCEMSE6_02946 [Oxalobacteraceae bacterium]
MTLPDNINSIITDLGLKNYLEIGVNTGDTFEKIVSTVKHAVDVDFKYDYLARSSSNCKYFQMPSDAYFVCPERFPVIDFAYIDGLHTFEQTLKDLLHVLGFSSEKTVIMIDDTFPSDWFSSLPNQQEAYKHRRMHMESNFNWAWNGDVFKLVPFIHDFLPAFNYASFRDDGNMLKLVLWKSKNINIRSPIFGNLEKISRLDYSHLETLLPYYFETNFELVSSELMRSTNDFR